MLNQFVNGHSLKVSLNCKRIKKKSKIRKYIIKLTAEINKCSRFILHN